MPASERLSAIGIRVGISTALAGLVVPLLG
jgi:hypothetical protein